MNMVLKLSLVILLLPFNAAGLTEEGLKSGGVLPDAGLQPAASSYLLGAEDQIALRVVDAEDLSEKPVRVDADGYIRMPMIGKVRAGGLTVGELAAELVEKLKPFIRKPDVSVRVVEYRSQPVSVIGCVKSPGVHQLQGRRSLIEVLSLAGGLGNDAGYTIKITREVQRGRLPLTDAVADTTGRYMIGDVNIKSLVAARNPELNILIMPYDVVSVPRAEMIYVTGEVLRSGGFVLGENETMSVLQALSLAGGLNSAASAGDSRILRFRPGSGRLEIPVDVKKILAGRAEDQALRSDDILFIPTSQPKKAAIRAVEAAIQVGTGVAIWRR